MDWFKRNKSGSASPSQSKPGTPSQAHTDLPNGVVDPVLSQPTGQTAEEKLEDYKKETSESFKEYDRKLESLALILFEKSEENEDLHNKLVTQESDMKSLLDKLEAAEKEISTHKDNQQEYKRRLEVLTDCLEDLARENMKLAVKSAPASMPDDYEEECFPTMEQVKEQQDKRNAAAAAAAESSLTKTGTIKRAGSSSVDIAPPVGPSMTVKHAPKVVITTSGTNASTLTSSSPSTAPVAQPLPLRPSNSSDIDPYAPRSAPSSASSSPETPELDVKRDSNIKKPKIGGGLVLPSKSKSKPDVSIGGSKNIAESSLSPTVTPKSSTPDGTINKSHKRTPSVNENDFSSMAHDPQSLMVLLKKYKAQSEQLRRDVIRANQKTDALQLSIDKYESKMSKADKKFRDTLLKEAKRRKDAEYVANILKKRVTELQFLLDEKDDSDDESSSSSDEEKIPGSDEKEPNQDEE